MIKITVVNNMELFQTIPVVDGIFNLTYIHNTGAAFGILAGKSVFLTLIPIVMLGVLSLVLVKNMKTCHRYTLLGMSLIIGGGIGNLIDRIRQGYVIDYMDFHIFPIFNLADVAVCIGCFLIILKLVLEKEKKDG